MCDLTVVETAPLAGGGSANSVRRETESVSSGALSKPAVCSLLELAPI